jgi:hypothetical protein
MPDKSTLIIIAVTIGAFLLGYWLISRIIGWVQNLNARPPLNTDTGDAPEDPPDNHH